MNYEMWWSGRWHANPLRVALPEQYLIQGCMRHLQAVALAAWCVHRPGTGSPDPRFRNEGPNQN
jgi:hypothetical protein